VADVMLLAMETWILAEKRGKSGFVATSGAFFCAQIANGALRL
jgi:hypothetical protein